jgi:biopolymer transport protein ExbD
MSKKAKFGKRPAASEDMALQITSMADIFMILLVFLLKSYSTSINNLAPTSGLTLPSVADKVVGEVKETVKLEISPSTILIDTKPVVNLANFEFPPGEIGANGQNPSIYSILFEERKRQPIPNMDSNLIVMADQETPYATLKTVVASAAAAGFVDLQLVVVEPE